MMAILTDVRWYFSIFLIWLSLIVTIFSCACWPSVYLPWRNIYLDLLILMPYLSLNVFSDPHSVFPLSFRFFFLFRMFFSQLLNIPKGHWPTSPPPSLQSKVQQSNLSHRSQIHFILPIFPPFIIRLFPGSYTVKTLPAMHEIQVRSLGWEDP